MCIFIYTGICIPWYSTFEVWEWISNIHCKFESMNQTGCQYNFHDSPYNDCDCPHAVTTGNDRSMMFPISHAMSPCMGNLWPDQIVAAAVTNMTVLNSLKLLYWLHDLCQSVPKHADLQDVSCHDIMLTSPIAQIIEIMTSTSPFQYKDRLIYVWRFPC